MLSADELHARAKRAANVGSRENALALLARARARTVDADLLARLDGTAAFATLELGRVADALQLCEDALGRPATPLTRGILLGQRALTLLSAGRPGDALADLEAAAVLLAAHPAYLGPCLSNRGNVRLAAADVPGAITDYEAAIEALGAAGLDTQRTMAEHNLGYALMLTGDLAQALERIGRALAGLGERPTPLRATMLTSQAEVLLMAGLRSEGRVRFEGALVALGQAHARRAAADARRVLALQLGEDDPQAGERHGAAAARQFRAIGAFRDALAADAVACACRLASGRDGEDRARALLGDLDAAGLATDAALLRLHLDRWLLEHGRGREVRGRLPRPDVLHGRLLAAEVSAGRSLLRGRRSAALAAISGALDDAQRMRLMLGSLDLVTALSQRTRHLSRRGLDLAVEGGRPPVVFEWSERARAQSSRVVAVRRAGDPALARDLAELRLLALDRADEARQAQLRARIREASWSATGRGADLDIVGLVDLRAHLDAAGAALVSHLICGTRLHILVVADRVRLIDAGSAERLPGLVAGLGADLDTAASVLAGPFRRAVAESLADTLARLDHQLIAPVWDTVGDRALVLTPSAPLHALPWGLLPSLAGRPVTVARSATAWVAAGQAAGQRPRRVLAVAGPGLAHADAEVRAVASAWGDAATVLTGPRATAGRVASVLARTAVDLVHVAAHGRHVGESPLFSRFDLADGPVFGYDLDAVSRPPALVVLSACDLAQAAGRGDDPLGLPTALLHAGVRTVIAASGRVSDVGSRVMSRELHAALAAGAPPADALATALAAVGDAHAVPFVCFGSGR